MGKPRTFSRKAKKFAKKKGLTPENPTESANFSIDDVLDRAEGYIEEYNYELAQKFLRKALEMDNDNIRALEMSASLLLEAGDVENAKHCLGRAVTVQPDEGHSKFLSLAQLFDGQESLQLYTQGIKIILNKISEEPGLKKDLSSTYCAIADLYMTDLCDDPNAEQECTKAIESAIQTDESNPESWQTKARLELIKTQFEDARISIKKSLSLWLPTYEAVFENKPATEGASNFDPVEVSPLPYTTRIAATKLLIELEEWDLAIKILDGLIEEDDEVVETWYLLGWVNRLRATLEQNETNGKSNGTTQSKVLLKGTTSDTESAADGYNNNARYYFQQAKRVHTSVKPSCDKEMISHIDELLEELGPGEPEAEDVDDGEDNEDDWETDQEEEMEQN